MSDLTAKDFELLAEQLRYVAREGDLIRVNAPETSMAAPFNGQGGHIEKFAECGWVHVRLESTSVRLRADEVLLL